LLRVLNGHEVRYVLVGGAALELHGSGYITQDVDIVYERSRENIRRLVKAIGPLQPRYRVQGVEGGLPIVWDERTIHSGDNFTLTTTLGDVDLLGIVAPGWRYEELVTRYTSSYDAGDISVNMLTLEGLRETKRAANRPKDHLALPEIDAMIEAQAVAQAEESQCEGKGS
jgi:hypothetical protein